MGSGLPDPEQDARSLSDYRTTETDCLGFGFRVRVILGQPVLSLGVAKAPCRCLSARYVEIAELAGRATACPGTEVHDVGTSPVMFFWVLI